MQRTVSEAGHDQSMGTAERLIVGFIVVAASLCVGLITVYLCMFDARGILN